jgi:hypothetical protein
MRHPFVLAAVASLATLAVPSAAHALDWNFSIQYANGESASGTFTTNGVAAVIGQIYTISSISGTHAPGGTITGLSPAGGANQAFTWNGSTVDANFSGTNGKRNVERVL